MKKIELFEKALNTSMHSRFAARADDLGRGLTDDETKAEAAYLLETIPYSGLEGAELRQAIKELRKIAQ